jgi:hypothetical protein
MNEMQEKPKICKKSINLVNIMNIALEIKK